jgi:hypothetical protein
MAWQDPHDPHGEEPQQEQAGPYDRPAPSAPYGPQYAAAPPVPNGSAIGALIANGSAIVFGFGGIGMAWLPGIILSVIALTRFRTDPESARRLTRWAWVCFVVDIVLTVVLFLAAFLFLWQPSLP